MKEKDIIKKAKQAQKKADYEDLTSTLKEIESNYTKAELRALAHGGRVVPGQARVPIVDFGGECVTIGCLSDTHIGSVYYKPEYLSQAVAQFKKEKIDFVVHCGDVCEGMSNRPGHIYELTHLGFDAQKKYAIEQLKCLKKWKVYVIDGNHDRWFVKSGGGIIVGDICSDLGFDFLGHDEGDISLSGKATIKLWHGEDGNSYAFSYRIQKIVEAFTGGEKPSVLMAGHVHKSLYVFDRHIHCYSLGALSTQSRWMRSKRMANHTGFWIVKLWLGKQGITKSQGVWYPFYS